MHRRGHPLERILNKLRQVADAKGRRASQAVNEVIASEPTCHRLRTVQGGLHLD